MNIELLKRHVENGVVNAVQHPYLPLTLYNYSNKCQYDRLWDDVTAQCRGLVMHNQKVVARPLKKFFNDTEHGEGEIPWHLPREITEKMDGSLLIVFEFGGKWISCTRGSFSSEQAIRGLDILARQYGLRALDSRHTYCFEVIYPENRIVVDYGKLEDVVLLAAFDTYTGHEIPLSHHESMLRVVRRLPMGTDARTLRTLIRDEEEGYVVRFSNGFRVKVKGEHYLRLHRIMSGISARMVWEYLSENKSLDDILAIVPEECADFVRSVSANLLADYSMIRQRIHDAHLEVSKLPTRKEQAIAINLHYKDIASAVFATLDSKTVDCIVWKMLYPEARTPKSATALDLL